jgi:hypothetical protein
MQSVVQRLGAMLENALKEHAASFRPLVPFLVHSAAEHGAGEKMESIVIMWKSVEFM